MNSLPHPNREVTSDRGHAWFLVGYSFLSMLIFAVLFATWERSGGMADSVLGFSIGMAFAITSSASFVRCPRRCFVAKSLTFLCLIPVLMFAVHMAVIVVGRWFLPGFTHW